VIVLFSARCLSCHWPWVSTRDRGSCAFCGAHNVLWRDHDLVAEDEQRKAAA
jgi:hypothetical protein